MAFLAIRIPLSLSARYELDEKTRECAEMDWMHPQDLHLTLRFFPDGREEALHKLQEHLATFPQPFPVSAFDLTLKGAGLFERIAQGGVFWARPEANLALDVLQKTLEDGLEEVGYAPESAQFTPHVTLARYSAPTVDKAFHYVQELETDASVGGTFRVTEFVLMKRITRDQGAKTRQKNSGQPLYTSIASYPLRD